MPVTPDILRRLGRLNLNQEQLSEVLGIIADMEEADFERKRKQRDRTARHRASRNVTAPPNDPNGGGVTLQQRDSNGHTPTPAPPSNPPTPAPVPTHSASAGARTREVPPDWEPNPMSWQRAVQWVLLNEKPEAAELEARTRQELDRFRDFSRSRGVLYADLDAAFLEFLTKPNRPRERRQASQTFTVVNGGRNYGTSRSKPNLDEELERIIQTNPLLAGLR